MSYFTFWKGFADVAVGIILLTKPELVYHSVLAKALHKLSGLRIPSPYPVSEDAISSQHAVASALHTATTPAAAVPVTTERACASLFLSPPSFTSHF